MEILGTNPLLVVDDEPHIQELVQLYLEKEGFTVALASDGEEALKKATDLSPRLIILDIMLPKKDGWEVCREIRKTSNVPIIMLTAKGEEFDRVLGLELGSDDYLSKPFSPRELLARIRALLRRSSMESEHKKSEIIQFQNTVINHTSREVAVQKEKITLTTKEFDLLWYLANRPQKVCSRKELVSSVWGYEHYGDLRTVDTHIKRLREKFKKVPHQAGFSISTVWGSGYKLEVEES